MEVNGKEFMRNIEIEKEKEALYQQSLKLDAEKIKATKPSQEKASPEYFDGGFDKAMKIEKEREIEPVDLTIEEPKPVSEILVDPTMTMNKNKKYIILSVTLILLFIITILAMRLVSNNETERELLSAEDKEIKKEEILNKIDSNEQYQNILDEKAKRSNGNDKLNNEESQILGEVPLSKVEDTPIVIDTPVVPVQKPKRDLFGLDKEEIAKQKITPKKVIKKVAKKVVQKIKSKPVAKKVVKYDKVKSFTTKSTKGWFIQLGAFSKQPSKKILQNITNKGYSYQIKKVTIKGRVLNKLLVGAYLTKRKARASLSKVRKDLKNPHAYILRF